MTTDREFKFEGPEIRHAEDRSSRVTCRNLSPYLIGGECEGVELCGVHYGHHPDRLLIGEVMIRIHLDNAEAFAITLN